MDTKTIKKVLVVGSGTMGSSIAQVFAAADIAVTMVDVDDRALARAMSLIESSLATLAEAGRLAKSDIPRIISRITPSTDLGGGVKDAAVVIEAVPEIPDLKKRIFAQLSDLCAEETVIASNTSALDIFSLTEVKRPDRLVVAHFFAPAHIIPLVEVVPGPGTSEETVSFMADLLRSVGKSPVRMKRFAPGFIVNRIQKAIGETVLDMIEQGLAAPEEIDKAVKLSLGVRLPVVGVVQTMDFQGLDMLLDTQRNYGKVYSFVEEKVKQGRLGVKTGQGIYDYGGRQETEVLKKRDGLFLDMLAYLKRIGAFEPV